MSKANFSEIAGRETGKDRSLTAYLYWSQTDIKGDRDFEAVQAVGTSRETNLKPPILSMSLMTPWYLNQGQTEVYRIKVVSKV